MSHPEQQVVCIELTGEDFKNPQKMEAFNEALQALNESALDYEEQVAQELNISFEIAREVVYLRSRSRWTERMEKELIRLHQAGTPPNIYEWPEEGSTLRD